MALPTSGSSRHSCGMAMIPPSTTPLQPPTSARAHVLVAVGGSDPGSAARWAAREARRSGTTVRLLHVAPHDLALEPGRVALRTAADVCRHESGDRVAVEAEQAVGDPVQVLLDASRDARLVVTGRRGSTSWHSTASISAELAARSPAPVCVVPPSWRATAQGVVGVGLDPGRPDRRSLTEAVRRARLEHAVLRVLVCRPGSLAPDHGDETDDLRHRAHAVLADCGGDACDVEVTVGAGHPASQLLEMAASTDLLVLGRRRHGGEHATYLGPVALAVLSRAVCPVLLGSPEPTEDPRRRGADHARR